MSFKEIAVFFELFDGSHYIEAVDIGKIIKMRSLHASKNGH